MLYIYLADEPKPMCVPLLATNNGCRGVSVVILVVLRKRKKSAFCVEIEIDGGKLTSFLSRELLANNQPKSQNNLPVDWLECKMYVSPNRILSCNSTEVGVHSDD